MTSSNTEPKGKEKPKGMRSKCTLWLILLALLLLSLMQWRLHEYKQSHLEAQRQSDSLHRVDSLRMADSMRRADSLEILRRQLLASGMDSAYMADSLRRADSLLASQRGRANGSFDTVALAKAREMKRLQDSLRKQAFHDSIVADSLLRVQALRKTDSLRLIAEAAARKAADPNPPTPGLVPPPGRYYEPLQLRVACNEPKCQGELSLGDSLHPQNGPVAYNKSGLVYYRATDSLGNTSAWISGAYDMASDNRCGANAYPVPLGGKQVCVDAYEYPNKPDSKPKEMVTQEMAARLCSEAGKRLCTIDEWQAACKGKSNSKYPYGARYDQTRCVTDSKEAKRSGRAEQCRSWWGMYDMAGNLWEWTASPAPQRSSMYLVAGGAWNTQDASHCGETKFSFYPQNEYPFVGFRCCADPK